MAGTMAPERPAIPEGTVTVLFTDLVGSTALNQRLGDEAAGALEREIEERALERVEKHRGTVLMETGDGLMAVFQSARRAVACAQDIQRAMDRHNRDRSSPVEMRIGLHTGEVLEESGELYGETLIIAKRIEGLAPASGIFVSSTVHGVLGTARAELVDRGEFELKGIASPWRLYEVPWAQEGDGGVLASNALTPFVGRTAERARIVELIEATREGSGALLLIAGEAGVGKSRLTEVAAAEARQRGLLPLVGHCSEAERAQPYLPLLEQIEEAARAMSPEALREALGENAPEVAKLMPELRQRYPDIPDPVELPHEQERRYLLHGVTEFFERAARAQPLALVFEDLHWADDSTMLLLRHLAQRLAETPILVLATYRHTELAPGRPLTAALPDLLRQRVAQEVVLSRLGEEDVRAVLRGRAGREPPSELVSLVYSETEGNPFFVEELFRHLHEAQKLFDENGEWRPAIQIADTEVPRGVGLVIGSRLERVSEECRRALTIAAVVGRTFRFDLLALFEDADEDRLLDVLEEASAATLVEDVSTGREARYAFVHEQIRQTLLSMLSFPRRQRLHLRVADGLEKLYGARVEERAAEVANHLYQAGAAAPSDRTARYLELAGDHAVRALAFEDALRHLEAAATVLPEGDREGNARVLALRALAFRGIGRIDEALGSFGQALELVSSGPEHDRILFERARLQLDLYRGREAIPDLDTLLEHARDAGDEQQELDVMLFLARANYIRSLDEPGFALPAREAYELAYARARELGDRRAMAKALIPTAWFTDYWLEYRPQAQANIEEARVLAEELDDDELRVESARMRLRVLTPADATAEGERLTERLQARRDPLRLNEHYFWMMWHYWARGQLDRCVETCNLGIDLVDRLGTEPVQYPTIKALALMDLGRFGDASDSLQQEVTDEAHRFGHAVQHLGMTVYFQCLGALDRAAESGRAVFDEARELSRTWMQRWLIDLLTTTALRMGERGKDLAAETRRLADESGFAPSSIAMAEAELLAGNFEKALELASSIAAGASEAGLARASVLALELELRALLELGRSADALATAEEALGWTEKTGFRAMTWRILASRARARDLERDGPGAGADRTAALRIFEELASSIPEASLRASFETEPLAASLLASVKEPA